MESAGDYNYDELQFGVGDGDEVSDALFDELMKRNLGYLKKDIQFMPREMLEALALYLYSSYMTLARESAVKSNQLDAALTHLTQNQDYEIIELTQDNYAQFVADAFGVEFKGDIS